MFHATVSANHSLIGVGAQPCGPVSHHRTKSSRRCSGTQLIVLPRACLSKTIVVFKNANQIIMDGSVLTEQAYGFLDRDRPARV
jgi:hypothetical protein